ncbi:small, acid-soluble spore protein, alpha/beta type [Clostridium scatologenes]|uniref:Small, acid-soluble spore protein, alpha/beta type n=1 Tax=Clostridium scatologenes TaxID=1548 RepID=A0A0E3GRN4_CLOSL|nr:small, acid-soluble spore protein, alpha/beta type [Clostridium scatologenes]AKA70626.1 hypothetical protein CSCA_3501 [Clostridium scatologenes]
MSHKNNKNSKDNKKVGKKTKKEIEDMKVEISNDIGFSSQTKKLGNNKAKEH